MGYLPQDNGPASSIPAQAQQVMRHGGPGGWGQLFGIIGLWLRRRGFQADEYYTHGLWRKNLPPAFLREFQTAGERRPFNEALRMPRRGPPTEVIQDKVATEGLLSAAGLPVTRTLAAFGPAPCPPAVTALPDAAAIAGWLARAPMPLFGKPRFGSHAKGAAAFAGYDAATQSLHLLNGPAVPVMALAEEIVADYPEGYIFQPFYTPDPDLARHVGTAMASVRICTLLTGRGVEPWYAVLRVPALRAMHDGKSVGDRVPALLDTGTGRVVRLTHQRDPLGPPITHWLDPGQPLLGYALPHWPGALQACISGHLRFPGHGIIGWDVFLTAQGALLNEANANPGHVYQVAARRGLRNADLEPAYQRALAFARAVNAEDSV
jgi:hypothetical protein